MTRSTLPARLRFRYIAPLCGFKFSENHFEVDSELRIEKMPISFDDTPWQGFLSKDDLFKISRCSHYLILDVRTGGYPRPNELLSLFLFSLWLARPTGTFIPFRFVKDDNELPVSPQAARIFDVYQPLKGDVFEKLSTNHLKHASRLFQRLKALSTNGGRLYTALTYAHYGCTTVRWQVGFTMFSAAFETIFFPDSKNHLTHKLAKRAACFLERSNSRRKSLYHRVRYFYDVRSAILHGRFVARLDDNTTSKKNLRDLKILSVTLRRVWRKVLADEQLISILNSDAMNRNLFFDRLCTGFKST